MDEKEILRQAASINGKRGWAAKVKKYGKKGASELMKRAVQKREENKLTNT